MTATNNDEYVKPFALAKELGELGPTIYSFIKSNKVRHQRTPDGSSALVHKQDVIDALAARDQRNAERSTIKRQKATHRSVDKLDAPVFVRKVPLHTILTWHPRLSGKKPIIGQVTRVERYFTTVTKTRMGEVEWRNEVLDELLKKKVVAILDPWKVLQMVMKQWANLGGKDRERAIRLQEFIKNELALAKNESSSTPTNSTSDD